MRNIALLILCTTIAAGCSTFDLDKLSATGANASAFCTTGGPGGVLGIGPSGIVTGAKVNEGFKGSIVVQPNCGLGIESD